MATQYGSTAKVFGLQQTDAETIATGNFIQFPVYSFGLTSSQTLSRDDLLSANVGRDGSDPFLETQTVQGNAVVPIDTVLFGHWLKMLLGAPATTGTTDKSHVFTSGKTALPDWTFEKWFPEIPNSDAYLGTKAGSLSFDMSPNGNAQATIALMGLSETSGATSIAGTPTLPAFQQFRRSQGAIKKDGVTLAKVTGGTFNFSNGMSMVQTIRNDARVDSIDLGQSTAGGDLRVRYTDNSFKTQAIAGTPMALEYSFTISATKAIKFELPRVFLNRPGVELTGPGGIELPITFQAAFSSAEGYMLRVSLLNNVASY